MLPKGLDSTNEKVIFVRTLRYLFNLIADADLLYETLKKVNMDYLTVADEASKFLSDNLKKKVAMLNSILNSDNSKTLFSRREDHPEWFEGSESNVVTKVFL